MDTQEQTVADFVKEHGVKISAERADSNPDMADWGNGRQTHYKCVIRKSRKSMQLHFSMGSALTGEPTVEDVLDCLASDASGIEQAESFHDWAQNLGFDTIDDEFNAARKAYKATKRNTLNLLRVLGEDAFGALVWHTERL